MTDIAHMKDQISFDNLFKRRAESGYEGRRQVRDKPDRVRQDDAAATRQTDFAHGWIKGGEHLIPGEDGGAGHAIEKGRFARLGVTDDGHRRVGNRAATAPVQLAGLDDVVQFPATCVTTVLQHTPVEFELRFTRAAQKAGSAARAALAFKVGPGSDETPLLIGKVRKFDL